VGVISEELNQLYSNEDEEGSIRWKETMKTLQSIDRLTTSELVRPCLEQRLDVTGDTECMNVEAVGEGEVGDPPREPLLTGTPVPSARTALLPLEMGTEIPLALFCREVEAT